MTLHEFIFSEKSSIRLLRHLFFWLIWTAFFSLTMGSSLMQEMSSNTLVNHPIQFFYCNILLNILTIHIPGCYLFIYFLLPEYILKKRRIRSVIGILLFTCFFAFVNYILWLIPVGQQYSIFNLDKDVPAKGYTLLSVWRYGLFTPPGLEKEGSQLMYSLQFGLFSLLKVIGGASVITLFKRWLQKQQENELIEREKVKTELALLKTQLHPRFLFNTLSTIYTYSLTATNKAANMVLKLSEVLSYMLYDCDQSQVPLEKELHLLKDYVGLEKLRYDGRIDIFLQVTGNAENKSIAPLLLLPLMENCINNCDDPSIEQPWININLNISESELHFKLTGSHSVKSPAMEETASLIDLRRRLETVYPEKHKFNSVSEGNVYVSSLKIDLETINYTEEDELIATHQAFT
ncbi:hypothetical protein C3K47_11190 [Solitalea longa]|uniref:Signal transduction histidine kinase internal region domain-containing protein n=1 Tax=Solitalea longa TaxID=2079460 RepID=A0A2S5A140_9SPHI|nr:sensor histidine kinase [Solitalea longa]POY36308.1 hypothetical protein C3K47_11190 [Solitalea longa]